MIEKGNKKLVIITYILVIIGVLGWALGGILWGAGFIHWSVPLIGFFFHGIGMLLAEINGWDTWAGSVC